MHTLNRILTFLFTVVVLLPPATFALVSLDQRDHAKESLHHAIETAVHSYRQRGAVQSLISKNQSLQVKGQVKIASLEKQKRDLRRKIVVQRNVIAYVSSRYGIAMTSSGQVALLIEEEKRRLVRLVRSRYFQLQLAEGDAPRQAVVRSMLHAAAGKAGRVGDGDLQEAQMRFIGDLSAAERAFDVLPDLERQRNDVLQQYRDASRQVAVAQNIVENGDVQLTDIQKITADVHDAVLKLQGELARIDAKLKSQAERALIEKGLIDPSILTAGHAMATAPTLTWPVFGGVSAGFMNGDYKKHFGVPHLGMDIVVAQETPVSAAADGVVFLVRDGGQTGYSYILIGHRGGYATLYGHVSQSLVSAGQQVFAGQEIALSGGTPGMHGSGPMTTGAHVHFEVIRAGVNVDPKSVLP
jgi:murein DD-endopeptidase MepM/ murein hydrolase activator NlpD